MEDIRKPVSLEQKEITDTIDALQKSKAQIDLRPLDSILINGVILTARIGEQLIYKVDKLSAHDENDMAWLGGFKFGKRQASGLVAVVVIICVTVCLLKWGPSLLKPFVSQVQPLKALVEKVN